ncbi:MAG TPA: hypothetical protein VGZ52_12015 [Acidimicrobiales bacterium]|jgi:hypothetical protein|nr:hypothetical protein [Acidimicrobiales bacterium]
MALFNRKHDKKDVLDLREQKPALRFGYPTPCPECGANGYLDSIDVEDQRMFQHCPTCFAKWETTEQELAKSR